MHGHAIVCNNSYLTPSGCALIHSHFIASHERLVPRLERGSVEIIKHFVDIRPGIVCVIHTVISGVLKIELNLRVVLCFNDYVH